MEFFYLDLFLLHQTVSDKIGFFIQLSKLLFLVIRYFFSMMGQFRFLNWQKCFLVHFVRQSTGAPYSYPQSTGHVEVNWKTTRWYCIYISINPKNLFCQIKTHRWDLLSNKVMGLYIAALLLYTPSTVGILLSFFGLVEKRGICNLIFFLHILFL